jgi:hypothetical protein
MSSTPRVMEERLYHTYAGVLNTRNHYGDATSQEEFHARIRVQDHDE